MTSKFKPGDVAWAIVCDELKYGKHPKAVKSTVESVSIVALSNGCELALVKLESGATYAEQALSASEAEALNRIKEIG